MKLAILSDAHGHWDNLQKAINITIERECDAIIFLGDFGGSAYWTSEFFSKFDGELYLVLGNHDAEKLGIMKCFPSKTKLKDISDRYLEFKFDDLKVFANHYPKISRLAAKSREYDLCLYGDSHKYHYEKIGETQLINPGALHPFKTDSGSFVIYNTALKEHERILI